VTTATIPTPTAPAETAGHAVARVTGVPDGRGGPLVRLAARMARRQFGHVPEPMRVTARSPWLYRGYLGFELGLMRTRAVDERLKDLAALRVAQLADCPFCVAIGSALLRARGVAEEKIAAVGVEGDEAAHTEVEQLVLEFAAAMTATPARVTDELVDRLRRHLGDEQLVELTGVIAFENYRARFNHAMGIEPETYHLRGRTRRRLGSQGRRHRFVG
jgi:AhpD family alkylhydroperoxidase